MCQHGQGDMVRQEWEEQQQVAGQVQVTTGVQQLPLLAAAAAALPLLAGVAVHNVEGLARCATRCC
jgi:hypothetical protein